MKNQIDGSRPVKKIVTGKTVKVCSTKNELFDNTNNDESLLTKKEIAEFLNVSVKMIDKMVCSNSLPYFKVGRLVRFSKKKVIEKISNGAT